MKCFTRFVEEHKPAMAFTVLTGISGLEGSFSLQLFRLGELEYEKVEEDNGERYISIHIPSDAVLDPEKIKASLCQAKKFFEKQDPSWDRVFL